MLGRMSGLCALRTLCGAGVALLLVGSGSAWAEADGPDAWRVVDVAPDDLLNVRMGPGTEYPVIGRFSHDARGLQQVTCVPLLKAPYYFQMTEAQLDALPPRWCLMQSADRSLEGWVAQRYLMEDHELDGEPPRAAQDVSVEAERLVQRLYDDHLRALGGGSTGPLDPARVGDFFTAPLAARIVRDGLQVDPLLDAQDAEITDLQVALDREQPMFRGMITVNADFRNFGYPRRAVVLLRVEEGAPRVIRIEHEGWSFE